MSKEKQRPQLEALARELAKHIKTEKDLSNLSRELTKMTVEAALGAEMEEHLATAAMSAAVRITTGMVLSASV